MEFVAMICDARMAAPGFRVESWAEGRERREVGADDRRLPHQLGESVPWARVRRPWQSPPGEAASGRRYGNLGFPLRWGCRRRFLRLRLGTKHLPLKKPN